MTPELKGSSATIGIPASKKQNNSSPLTIQIQYITGGGGGVSCDTPGIYPSLSEYTPFPLIYTMLPESTPPPQNITPFKH